MRVLLAVVGRLKAGAERDLCARYLARAAAAGRSLGLADFAVREIAESQAARAAERCAAEAERLRGALVAGARFVAFDERGEALSSAGFARDIAAARDSGTPAYVVALGGPDGLDAGLRGRADRVVAFGAMTWPHQLARVMAAEQLYRATTILGGHPYHRG